jgi:hypothetical protein
MDSCPARRNRSAPAPSGRRACAGRVGVDDRVGNGVRGTPVVEAARDPAASRSLSSACGVPRAKRKGNLSVSVSCVGGEIVPQVRSARPAARPRGHHLEDVEMMREPHVVAEIRAEPGRRPRRIGGMGRTRPGLKASAPSSSSHVAMRARRRGNGWISARASAASTMSRPIWTMSSSSTRAPARRRSSRASGSSTLHPQLFEHAQRGLVHVRRLVVGEDGHRRERVAQLSVVHVALGRGRLRASARAAAVRRGLAGASAQARIARPSGS